MRFIILLVILLSAQTDTLSQMRQYGGLSALAFLPGQRLITLSAFDSLTYADGALAGDAQGRLWSTSPNRGGETNDTTVQAPDTGDIYYLQPAGDGLLEAMQIQLMDERGQVAMTFERDTFDFGKYQLSLDPGDYFAGKVTLRDEQNKRVATLGGAHDLFPNDGRYVLTWRYRAELWLTSYGIYSWPQRAPFHQLTDQERQRYPLD